MNFLKLNHLVSPLFIKDKFSFDAKFQYVFEFSVKLFEQLLKELDNLYLILLLF